MSDTLSLTTPDPRFDPDKPVKVNGFYFLPARRVLAKGRAGLEPMGGDDVTSSAGRAITISTDRGAADSVPVQQEIDQ